MPKNSRFHNLDRIDRAILAALQRNGRDSFARLGKEVGLSATSVAERVRQLENAGIIEGYEARVSAAKIGYPIMAFILARPKGPDSHFVRVARERKEVVACHRVTGEFSFIAQAVLEDVAHLETLLNHLEPAAVHIVTLVVLSTPFDNLPPALDAGTSDGPKRAKSRPASSGPKAGRNRP